MLDKSGNTAIFIFIFTGNHEVEYIILKCECIKRGEINQLKMKKKKEKRKGTIKNKKILHKEKKLPLQN